MCYIKSENHIGNALLQKFPNSYQLVTAVQWCPPPIMGPGIDWSQETCLVGADNHCAIERNS